MFPKRIQKENGDTLARQSMTQQNELMFALCSLSRKRCNTKRQVQSGEIVWSSGKNIVGLTLKQWHSPLTNGNLCPYKTYHGASLVSNHMFPNTCVCCISFFLQMPLQVYLCKNPKPPCYLRRDLFCFLLFRSQSERSQKNASPEKKQKDTCSFHALYMHFLWL